MKAATMLVFWLSTAIAHWLPAHPSPARDAYYDAVAREILTVTFKESEPAIMKYRGVNGRAHTALLEAAIGVRESQFRTDVQAGRCRTWECDGGAAACWLQVQTSTGIILDGKWWTYAAHQPASWVATQTVFHADDLQDPPVCLEVGLHMARASIEKYGSLGGYTGEGGEGPLAHERQRLADEWFAKHPPPVDDELVMGENTN